VYPRVYHRVYITRIPPWVYYRVYIAQYASLGIPQVYIAQDTSLYASLVPWWVYHTSLYMPSYVLPGTPCCTPTHPVLPGTLSPPGTVPDDEALGSNLGLIREKEASARLNASLPVMKERSCCAEC